MRYVGLRSSMILLAASSAVGGCSTTESGPVAGDVQNVTEGPKLAFDEYSVLFTNPVCKKYDYAKDQDVHSNGGARLTHKPENSS